MRVAGCALKPNQISVGASGALMGTMGGWLVHILTRWNVSSEDYGAKAFSLVICVVNILVIVGFSFVPFIDWAAHLGGLLSGILSHFSSWPHPYRTGLPDSYRMRRCWRLLWPALSYGPIRTPHCSSIANS
jgi:membrane associated rhomboid family serine protease